MANEIVPGTIACEPGTLAGSIFDVLNSLVPPEQQELLETGLKRMAFAFASGWVSNVVASITDQRVLQVLSGEIVGADLEGGAAPDTAEYLVGVGVGALPNERVVTNTDTVKWDLSTGGQAKADVPAASTTVKGVVELATSGQTTAGLAVQASDSRLSDARAPTAHAASHGNGAGDEIDVTGLSGELADAQKAKAHAGSHQSGQSDELKLDDLGSPDDNTDLNATTLAHGLLPKLPGNSAQYLDGSGNWTVPGGSMEPIFLSPAESFGDVSSTLFPGSNQIYLPLADATTTDLHWHFRLPSSYTGSDLQITIYWACGTTTAGDVRLLRNVRRWVDGESALSLNSTSVVTNQTVSGTANQQETFTFTIAADSAVAGDWVRLWLSRQGGSGTDTYAGQMNLFGVLVEET